MIKAETVEYDICKVEIGGEPLILVGELASIYTSVRSSFVSKGLFDSKEKFDKIFMESISEAPPESISDKK